MADEQLWRRRFAIFMLARLAGLALFFLGVAIAFSSLVQEGGAPALGAVLAILGVLDAVFVSRLLKKHWKTEDARRP